MSGRHAADAKHPAPSPWAKPRIVEPPKHSTQVAHVHDFVIVATFTGIRESISQCGCGETKTVFHTEVDI